MDYMTYSYARASLLFGSLSNKQIGEVVLRAAERSLALVKNPDPRSIEAIVAARKYLRGEITKDAMFEAKAAADSVSTLSQSHPKLPGAVISNAVNYVYGGCNYLPGVLSAIDIAEEAARDHAAMILHEKQKKEEGYTDTCPSLIAERRYAASHAVDCERYARSKHIHELESAKKGVVA